MFKKLSVAVLIAVIFLITTNPLIASPGDIISSNGIPSSHPTGLTFDGKNIWMADRFSDSLYAVNPGDGSVEKTISAPGFIPRGLAWDGKYLWCVDGEENRIIQLDIKTGMAINSIESPTSNPHGLTWDGKYLWLGDAGSRKISRISTDDGTTIVSHQAPSRNTDGLTWWNGYIWCSDRRDDKIYLVDSEHGEVVFGFDSPGKYPRGLATDGKVLWNVDYQDDKIYKLVIDDDNPIKTSNSTTLNMTLNYEFRNYGPGEVPELNIYIAFPSDLPNQVLKSDVLFDPAPMAFIEDRWNQRIAYFKLEDLGISERNMVTMEVTAELSDAHHYIYPHKVRSENEIPKDIQKLYLVDEDKYMINDPIIKRAVKEAVGDENNLYWKMRKIHKYIRERLHYELAGGWNVAPKVLERGNGSCSEYTFVFISMCRSAGIPARYVGAVVVRGDDASTDQYFHRWSQVYLPGYGWIHVDPQGGDKEKPADVAESIGVVDNRFLITTTGGGASEYLGWGYNYDQHWISKGPVKIFTEATGEWSPADVEDE